MMDPLQPERKVELHQGDVIFVGEGPDDCAVLRHLTQQWDPIPEILTRNDRDPNAKRLNWDKQFRALVLQALARGIYGVGVVFDAESNRTKRMSMLRKMFKTAELDFPSKANKVQVVKVDRKRIKVAYFINPSGKKSGCIETLFRPQVDQSELGSCLDGLIKCYRRGKITLPANEDKLRVRTYLAQRNPSNTGLSIALRDGTLECESKGFDALRRFVALLKPTPLSLFNGLHNDAGVGS